MARLGIVDGQFESSAQATVTGAMAGRIGGDRLPSSLRLDHPSEAQSLPSLAGGNQTVGG
ncbi:MULTISPECIES: hypothetical protein [Cyanophyceae]|uniref:hypothetical protein n=1 Tax=Cyanophyceae TaxID=3028117 RepID=UPI001683144D|nr:hypothetical protein [Nodosilinea sp. FACHB-141]